ncbi:MAG: dihydropteroate synthase [Abyssibacter sp.]|uniref:dihydropteroate synthase n=1 Tax=Abyssibacter sp. TaxID=2320200 RepID=UPI00321B7DA9
MSLGQTVLNKAVAIMGVLNITPDSFSDGGRYLSVAAALAQAEALVTAGADILDIGGESTRPGASEVSEAEEIDRVVPVIQAVRQRFDVTISVDTRKPSVMRAAVAAGAHWINDVEALRAPGALDAAVELDVPVCLMHMQGQPGTMQKAPSYTDVTTEVTEFLLERARACVRAGLQPDRILLDPGFGFGKTLAHNTALFQGLPTLVAQGYPVLVGVSRKRMLGQLLDEPEPEGRVLGGAVAAVLALQYGARVVRTHDVKETAQAIRILNALAPMQ